MTVNAGTKRKSPDLQGFSLISCCGFRTDPHVFGSQLTQNVNPFYFRPKAFAAFILPPLATFPLSELILSTDLTMRSRSFSSEMFGSFAMISAATPETYGVAIDVPDASR